MRPLHNGDFAAALVNTGSAAQDITLRLGDALCASCPPKARVEDVWAADATLPSSSGLADGPVTAEGSFTAKGVAPHETVLLRLTPVADKQEL